MLTATHFSFGEGGVQSQLAKLGEMEGEIVGLFAVARSAGEEGSLNPLVTMALRMLENWWERLFSQYTKHYYSPIESIYEAIMRIDEKVRQGVERNVDFRPVGLSVLFIKRDNAFLFHLQGGQIVRVSQCVELSQITPIIIQQNPPKALGTSQDLESKIYLQRYQLRPMERFVLGSEYGISILKGSFLEHSRDEAAEAAKSFGKLIYERNPEAHEEFILVDYSV